VDVVGNGVAAGDVADAPVVAVDPEIGSTEG